MCQAAFLPPNTTSHLQPLDAGIIKAFKAWYCQSQLQCFVKLREENKKPDVNLKEAICFLALAWQSVSATSIANFWKHTAIVSSSGGNNDEQEEVYPVGDLSRLLQDDRLRSSECLSADT